MDKNNKLPAVRTPFGVIDSSSFQHIGIVGKSELDAIVNALPAGVVVIDAQLRVIGCNVAFSQLLGINGEKSHGQTSSLGNFLRPDGTILPQEEFPALLAVKEQRMLQGIVVGVEKKDGHRMWTEVCAIPLALSENRCLIVAREITERIDDLEALRHSEMKFRHLSKQLEAILDHIPGLVFYKDTNNNFVRVNRYVADAHKKVKADMEGVSLYDLYPKEQAEAYYQDDLEVIRSGEAKLNIEESWSTEKGLRYVNTSKIPFVDEGGAVIGVIGISLDITERKDSEKLINELVLRLEKEKEQARAHALTDGLTGVANRRHFDEKLEKEILRLKRHKGSLSLIMLDIDFFKKFNDEFGHVAGDHCLKRVATVVRESVGRAADFVARYGGEEFVVVMPDTKTRGAQIVAERIRQAVENLALDAKGSDGCRRVTVSLGVATVYPGRSDYYEDIVDLADTALYRAKANGRNRYEVAIQDTSFTVPLDEPSGFVELSWHDDFNSGNATIDLHHKKLFKTSSRLLSAISSGKAKDECVALIEDLLEDTKQHFRDEENILTVLKYPLAEEHAQIHRGLLARADELSKKFESGYLAIGELFTFIANDIIWHHMYVEDKKFFSYF